ncbi:hypothetical protein [Ectothiorhodospira shaposhnikovii]|uniref:hypothetical protein n=1 Tax=Ectothiorhodospira shaposhnikovii TaxID=1054 RepID=UPI001EE959B5|nr:hypothetical protein [Ectothiorhodospira shaposhnikovii]MCG5512864.1 hypothetical protein [Ectothiorhodospira shaposhnikovii]
MDNRISIATAIEKNKIASDTPFLFLLVIEVVNPDTGTTVETLRIANNNEPVSHKGNHYDPAHFELNTRNASGEIQQIQLTITDLTRAIQARMQAYGGGVGFRVTLIAINAGQPDEEPYHFERFEVTGASAKDYVVTWTLGAENPLTMNFPRRRQMRDFCPWRYKGEDCGYVGPMTECDLSLAGPKGCRAHNNEHRFGGCPAIPNAGTRYV